MRFVGLHVDVFPLMNLGGAGYDTHVTGADGQDTTNNVETCKGCEGRVYPLEKVSCHNSVYHKNCFRCRECNTVLRMDSYSYNQGLLYCTPHFKRLFIARGDYETGFGLDQPRGKWNSVS